MKFKEGLLRKDEEYGHFDTEEYHIMLDKDMPQSLKEETFWHEVVEAFNLVYEFEFDHDVIQKLGAVIHQVAGSVTWQNSSSKSGTTKKTARSTSQSKQQKRAKKK